MIKRKLSILTVALAAALTPAMGYAHGGPGMSGLAVVAAPVAPPPPSAGGTILDRVTQLLASFYGHGERLSRYTADGEVFDPDGFTAAHRTLPIGARLRVTYKGRSVTVRVNDRGPAAWTGRALDLSYGAARAIGLTDRGVGLVQVAILN
jgi:hypothetical protein